MTPNDRSLHYRCMRVCKYTPAHPRDKKFLDLVAAKLRQHINISAVDRSTAEALCAQHGQGVES
jgi:hypothetical protein